MRFVFSFALTVVFSCTAFAQPTYSELCGTVSGTLVLANSPYLVTCDVTVANGQTLVIEPGVELKFAGHYKFSIHGNLQAVGTEEDSILFTRAYPTEESKWWGIRFLNADDTCRLSHCVVEYGLGDGPTIEDRHGGGIWSDYTSLELLNSAIRYNHATDDGGGMAMQHAPYARISHCTFFDNTCVDIPGTLAAGGLDLSVNSGDLRVDHCLFSQNHTDKDAGALDLYLNTGLVIENCTFVANTSAGYGPAIRSYGTHNIKNCVLWNNSGMGGQAYGTNGTLTILYSDIQGGYTGTGNINLDPQFVDELAADFHLTASSPCIDAGDPTSVLDPDGTGNDMGAFPFYHVLEGEISGTVTPNYSGIMIDLMDQENTLVSAVLTEANGTYAFENVPAGTYVVELIEPLGFTVNLNHVAVVLQAGSSATVDFQLNQTVTTNDARSKGYWKHQVNVHLNNRGQAEYTADQLLGFSQAIFNCFYQSPVYPIAVEGVTFSGEAPSSLTLQGMGEMLSINQGGSTMYERACSEYLALLLNVTSGKLAQYFQASVDGATVSQAIVYIHTILGTSSEQAKNVAETLNHAETVASGVIPLSTPNILFANGANFDPPSPNPFNPTTTFSFSLAAATDVKLAVYDVLGRTVATLVEGVRNAGNHHVTFNGSALPSGVYFARFQAGSYVKIQKVLLAR